MSAAGTEIASQEPTTTQDVLRFWGFRRSGNHAIIDWIRAAAAAEDTLLLNNCAMRRPAFEGFSELEWRGKVYSRRNVRRGALSDDALRTIRSAPQILVSYEDVAVDLMLKRRANALTPDLDAAVRMDIVILRSLENWLASFWTHLKAKHGSDLTVSRIALVLRMLAHWKSADSITREPAFVEDVSLMVVWYDRWLADAGYRDALISSLGYPSAPALPDVTTFGGGSSFDGLDFRGRATEMKLTERWRAVEQDEAFRRLVQLALHDNALRAQLAEHHPATLAVLSGQFGATGFPPTLQAPTQQPITVNMSGGSHHG